MIAKSLREHFLLRLNLLARRIVRADEKVADDRPFRIPQRRHRHDRGKAAAIFTDIGQLVDILNASGGLEN